MCNLYSITKRQAAVIQIARAMRDRAGGGGTSVRLGRTTLIATLHSALHAALHTTLRRTTLHTALHAALDLGESVNGQRQYRGRDDPFSHHKALRY